MDSTVKTSKQSSPNYFNYFTEIEDAFIRLRGKHLLLSTTDWVLMELWRAREIPIHVILRSLEIVFSRHRRSPKSPKINSLSYCRDEVEAQFAEWQKNQIGRGENTDDTKGKESCDDAYLSFPRATILAHLANCHTALIAVITNLPRQDEFSERLEIINSNLKNLELDFAQAAAPDCEELESELSKLEHALNQALLTHVPSYQSAKCLAEAEQQLKSYRGRMKSDYYQQAVNNLLLSCLRKVTGIPPLSLFRL